LNEAIVFEALSAAGITRVLVNFDGAGDGGQIEDANAYAGDKLVDFPATTVTLHRQQYGNEELTTHEMSLREAVEELCYGYLEQENAGWENNDGAFGEFNFDVAERRIALDFNERFIDYTQHDYTF
jgi:hypothetical protein